MRTKNWVWFHTKLRTTVEPVLTKRGFLVVENSEEEGDDVLREDDEEKDPEGAYLIYANNKNIRIGFEVIVTIDTEHRGVEKRNIYWLRAGTGKFSFKQMMFPGAAQPQNPFELNDWKCLTGDEVEQRLDEIAVWLDQNLDQFLQ